MSDRESYTDAAQAASDVNRAIDNALSVYAQGMSSVELAIASGNAEAALPTLAHLHVAFRRMASLARLSAPEGGYYRVYAD